jgi:hypothetical protein
MFPVALDATPGGGTPSFPFLVALKRIQLVATSASWSVTGEDVELIHLLRRHLQTAMVCLGAIVAERSLRMTKRWAGTRKGLLLRRLSPG